MVRVMRTLWKIFLPLALVLPLGAFVAGSLVASSASESQPRDTIVIRESGSTPSSNPSRPRRAGEPGNGPLGHHDVQRRHATRVDTVTVEPDDVDDDSGAQDSYDDHGSHDSGHADDDSGHHGGDDDSGSGTRARGRPSSSGHGGGEQRPRRWRRRRRPRRWR